VQREAGALKMNILIYYIKKYILGALISLYGNRRLIGPNISRTEPKIFCSVLEILAKRRSRNGHFTALL